MKKTLGMMVVVLALTASSWADYQDGNQLVSVRLGPAGYSKDLNVNNGENKLRDCGGSGGLQYLYVLHQGPTLALGPDILWADFSEEDPSGILRGDKSKSSAHTAVYQLVAKLAYPNGHWRPYILGGIGDARSSLQSHISSASGAGVQTFDSVRNGFAGTWALGLDVFPREHWFFGLELRQVMLSRLEHQPTAAGAALGIQSTRDPSSITSLLLNIGYKFGKN